MSWYQAVSFVLSLPTFLRPTPGGCCVDTRQLHSTPQCTLPAARWLPARRWTSGSPAPSRCVSVALLGHLRENLSGICARSSITPSCGVCDWLRAHIRGWSCGWPGLRRASPQARLELPVSRHRGQHWVSSSFLVSAGDGCKMRCYRIMALL